MQSGGAQPAPDIGQSQQAATAAPDSNCTERSFGGGEYWFCDDHRDWQDAQGRCQAVGLDLVRIDTAEENDFVRSHVGSDTWIGGNDRATEGTWVWPIGGDQFWQGDEHGSAVGGLFESWGAGQPNDLGGEDCAQIFPDGNWLDDGCEDREEYVCEGDACPSDPNKLEPGICGCGVADIDTDGDGRPDCLDFCPRDPSKVEPGDCGCSDAPASAGTACDDGLCAANTQCDGAGTCGNPADCAPATGCTYQHFAGESGRGYFFCPGSVDWSTAKTTCESRPGTALVRIDDAAENAFVFSHVSTASWIGANDRTLEGFWKWAQPGSNDGDRFWTGKALLGHAEGGLFTSWKSEQPDDAGNADCGHIDPANAGGWDDASCSARAGYVCEIGPHPCAGTQAGAPWPATRRCAGHDARSPVVGAQTNDLNWATPLAGTTPVGSPSIGADGTVYVAAGAEVFAISEAGTVKWSFTAPASVESTPALGRDGTVYVGASNEHLYGLSATGSLQLDRDLLHPIYSSPVIGTNGRVYVANGDDLSTLAPDGTKLWDEDVGPSDGLSPAVGPHGTIYIGSTVLNRMLALAPGGDRLWTFGTGLSGVSTTAAIGEDGTIYFGAGKALFAVTPGGAQSWKYTTSATVTGTPAIGADGTVYTTSAGAVHAVTGATGIARWTQSVSGIGSSAPAVDASGNVYVGSSDGAVYALNPSDGSTLWSLATGGAVLSSPAVGNSGTIYVGSADGKLYSIGGGPTPFVNCVTEVGSDRFVALFGYDNRAGGPQTVPLGPQNELTPTPALATAQPPTVFAPGHAEIGFWVPMDGPSLTWTLRGLNATASVATTPMCEPDMYPQVATIASDPETHGTVASNLPKPEPYFDADSTTALGSNPSSSNSVSSESGTGVVQQAVMTGTLSLPFTVELSAIVRDDACIGPSSPYAKVTINGGAEQRIALPDECGLSRLCIVSENVPVDAAEVPVHIELWEHDTPLCGGGDDHEVDVDVDVDNHTGSFVGSSKIPSDGSINISGTLDGSVHGNDSSTLFFRFGPNGPPEVTPPPRLCATWNTAYVDEEFGEDFLGDQALPSQRRVVPASFAEFFLHVEGPFGTFTVGPNVFLDQDGCVPAGTLPDDALLFATDAPLGDTAQGGIAIEFDYGTHLERPDGVEFSVRDFTNSNEILAVITSNAPDSQGLVDLDPSVWWTPSGPWSVPKERILTSLDRTLSPMTNTAAAMSRLASASDMGIVPGNYPVIVGTGCPFSGNLDSCAEGSADLLIGPLHTPPNAGPCTTRDDCPGIQECVTGLCRWPDESRWKFIAAHEAGHLIQARAMGTLDNPYLWDANGNSCPGKHGEMNATNDDQKLLDPPCGELFCGCEHVESANGYHCLQSIENTSTAALEGFAQFFASKAWNRQDQDDCTFVYYKEFLSPDGCPPGAECMPFPSTPEDQPFAYQHGVVQSILPPLPVDCRDTAETRWRNDFCPMPDYGTELDWMRFFWNVNTVGPDVSTMDDIFQIYRHACHPNDSIPADCGADPTCREQERCGRIFASSVGWEPGTSTALGFRQGAELNYGPTDSKYRKVLDLGDRFGVSLDLTKN